MGVDVLMYVQCPRLMRLDEVQALDNELPAEVGEHVFYDEAVHFACALDVEGQAGPELLHAEGSVLEVEVYARHLGVGYDRGELHKLIAIAEAIERKIPGAIVWYGGDGGGYRPEPWTAEDRAALAEKHKDEMRVHEERLEASRKAVVAEVEAEGA